MVLVGVDLPLPAQPNVGVDVVGVVGDIELVNRDGVEADGHHLSRGRRGTLRFEAPLLHRAGAGPAGKQKDQG